MARRILIYADGSAGKDSSGGWGAVLLYGSRKIEISGGVLQGTTNQQAEIVACIVALRKIKKDRRYKVLIRSDSAYVVNCFREGWIKNWRRKEWRHKGGERPNRAYWETLESLVELHDVEFEHVRGHAGDKYNERADELAVAGRLAAIKGEM